MGLFRKRDEQQAELDRLNAEIRQLANRLDAADREKAALAAKLTDASTSRDELSTKLHRLSVRIDEQQQQQNTSLPAPTQQFALADQAVIDELRVHLDRLGVRIDEVDTRVTNTATELSNQLAELGSEGAADGAEPVTNADALVALGEIQDAQVRLANEQARYQIAFRQDLAELAERLKR